MTATGTVRFGNARAPRADQVEPALAGAARFTRVPTAVVRGQALGLSPWAKLLYVALCSYADPAGACYPGYATLRTDIGCGVNQLTRAMRELEAAGLVTRRRRGQGHPTRYTVHAPSTTVPDPAPEPVQIHAGSESRVTPSVNQESLLGGVEQDSVELDPEEQHHSAPAALLAPTPRDLDDPTGTGDDDALLAALISRGITPRVAQTLQRTHDAQAIREQLAWHPHRPAATNPAGALVQAIRERWPAPPAWQAAQAHAATAARQAEQDAQRQAEDDARRRAWAAKPPEERIAGRLTFWIQSRRVKRHEPTAAEIAVRRGELLAELLAELDRPAAGDP